MKENPASLAKTTRPSLVGVLTRERLFKMLDKGRRCPVIWVTGPPGSGKTTLVASYLEGSRPRSLWYQLDRGDSDVATFFYYMASAVAEIDKKKRARLPLFTAEYHSDLSAFTRRFFQKLYQQLDSSFVMVFDGYQEISPQSLLHNVIRDAVEEMPSNGCLVIVSRIDPPSSMARLRANRAMEVVTWDDLRLTLEETGEIVKLWGVDTSAEMLKQLYEKTEGWAAGLVLLLDQLNTHGTVEDLPDLSAHQVVFDYLAGEIFQKFDTRTRVFLLKTAYLAEMTGHMAKEVTGDTDASDLLNDLHRNYHFVSMKPGTPDALYQYHPLLHEFLVAKVRESFSSDECLQLLRRSAEVLNDSGKIKEAVTLLQQARDWEGMARLIMEHAATMLGHGRRETLNQWLEELPEDVLQTNPWFFYWQAACRFVSAPRESRILYETAYRMFSAEKDVDYEGLILSISGVMDAIFYELDDLTLLDRWIDLLDRAFRDYADRISKTAEARSTASMFYSLMMRRPEHPDIESWGLKAYAISLEITDPNLRMSIEPLVAISATYIGYFAKAKMVIDTMRQFCASPHVTPLAVLTLRNVESMYYMFTARHEECLKAVYDGLEIARNSGVHMWSYHLLGNGVAGALGGGDMETANNLLKQMDEFPDRPRRLDSALYHYYSAWDAMLHKDIPRAFQEQKTALKRARESGCRYFEVLCRLAMVQVLVEYGDEDGVATHQRQLREIAPALNNRLLDFMCGLVTAYVDFKAGREQPGLDALRGAMALGRENGYTHFLWWQPDFMSSLCIRALDAEIEVDYVKRLIQKRGLIPAELSVTTENWPWTFRVYSLGKFRILKNDQPLGFLSKLQLKPMELLKAIIAFGGEDIPEDQIAASLWPRIEGDYAHRSLTTTLHRLRKMLGENGGVVLQHGRISLSKQFWWLDTWALEKVFVEIDNLFRLSTRRVPEEKVTQLAEQIFSLYHGPFMSSESGHPWHVSLQEQLRNKFLRYMGDLGRYREDKQQWDIAIQYYQRGLEVDALAEGFCRRLMLCYREIGRRAEAIEAYESCKKTLQALQKTEPSPETTAIYENLLHEI